MAISFHWSDRLEILADALFKKPPLTDPFHAEAVIVHGAVMEGWLKHYFLLQSPTHVSLRRPVLANMDFLPLHPFVNDWLAKALYNTPIGERQPARHPYSKSALQWRIFALLNATQPALQIIQKHLKITAETPATRRWSLAGKLAQLYDDYQNYRPKLLAHWDHPAYRLLCDEDLQWQVQLWQALLAENPHSYLADFTALQSTQALQSCGITEAYQRISLFHVGSLPPAYLAFFTQLSSILPVDCFCWNPSQAFWLEDPSLRSSLLKLIAEEKTYADSPLLPETPATSDLSWHESAHPLLNHFGRGTQAFLAEVLDWSEGEIHETGWGENQSDCLLHQIQHSIRTQSSAPLPFPPDVSPPDPLRPPQNPTPVVPNTPTSPHHDASVQIHICPHAIRELEVVHDCVLNWFQQHPEMEPRSVQILVADFESYATQIESVFQINHPHAAFPCVMSQRPAHQSNRISEVFLQLIRLPESRLSVTEVCEWLELESFRGALGLSLDQSQTLRHFIEAAAIRWGAHATHIRTLLDSPQMPDTLTWRRGIDRLLAGWALGHLESPPPDAPAESPLYNAGELGELLALDILEDDVAESVGVLGNFLDRLCEFTEALSHPRSVSAWHTLLSRELEHFFLSTEEAFYELTQIRRALQHLQEDAAYAQNPTVSYEVIAAALESHFQQAFRSSPCIANAVLITPLQANLATPRELIILVGLNEGVFPRADQRAQFDLLSRHPKLHDRSLRREDRLAFLEALVHARSQLIITYTGHDTASQKPLPPAAILTEFQQYLGTRVTPIEHPLQGFHPSYFTARTAASAPPLFQSFSISNFPIACAINTPSLPTATTPEPEDDDSEFEAAEYEPAPPLAVPQNRSLAAFIDSFLNPAKAFYKDTLHASLPDFSIPPMASEEPFKTDKLDEYQIKQTLLKAFLSAGPAEDPLEETLLKLQEAGILPLGDYGIAQTRPLAEDVRTRLHSTSAALQTPYFDLLQSLQEHPLTSFQFTYKNFTLSGALPLLSNPNVSTRHTLCFHLASSKAKRLVPLWLYHLVGHAAGLTFTSLYCTEKERTLLGKKAIVIHESFIKPLPREFARAALIPLLEAFLDPSNHPLPFAPETSFAFAKPVKEGRGKSATIRPPTRKEGLQEATKAWQGVPPFALGESSDRFLTATWGPDGPLLQPHFPTLARAFWEPFFDFFQD